MSESDDVTKHYEFSYMYIRVNGGTTTRIWNGRICEITLINQWRPLK